MKEMVLICNLSNQFSDSTLRINFVVRFKINHLDSKVFCFCCAFQTKQSKTKWLFSKPFHYCYASCIFQEQN